MLPDPTVPPSLMALLEKLGTFTSPSLRTFAALVTWLIAATGKRTPGSLGPIRARGEDPLHAAPLTTQIPTTTAIPHRPTPEP